MILIFPKDQGKSQIAFPQNVAGRDLTIARRIIMLEMLWHELYLPQKQLIARADTFHLD